MINNTSQKRDAKRRLHKMLIAVTYEDGNVFQHFGHTESFKLYEVEDGEIKSSHIMDTNGTGHEALAGLLANQIPPLQLFSITKP
jgi:predicted Fe-Mo cluster-binding NifX family protein